MMSGKDLQRAGLCHSSFPATLPVNNSSNGDMMTLLDLLTIVGTGLMVGNEIAIAAFVHPAISKLKAQSHLSAAKASLHLSAG